MRTHRGHDTRSRVPRAQRVCGLCPAFHCARLRSSRVVWRMRRVCGLCPAFQTTRDARSMCPARARVKHPARALHLPLLLCMAASLSSRCNGPGDAKPAHSSDSTCHYCLACLPHYQSVTAKHPKPRRSKAPAMLFQAIAFTRRPSARDDSDERGVVPRQLLARQPRDEEPRRRPAPASRRHSSVACAGRCTRESRARLRAVRTGPAETPRAERCTRESRARLWTAACTRARVCVWSLEAGHCRRRSDRIGPRCGLSRRHERCTRESRTRLCAVRIGPA
jgi:hypothetical protein